MIRLHAILSLSGAHIWTKCAPSARFQEQIPEQDTVYSEEGTLAHGFAAILLECWVNGWTNTLLDERFNFQYNKARAWYVQNKPDENADYMTQEMVGHAETFARYVYEIGGVVLVEERLDLSRFIPLSWGTADGLNLFPDVIYVSDFKFGAGQRVHADENDQMMGYALGAYLRAVALGYDPHTVIMSIIQPRMSNEPSVAQISVTDLLAWASDVVAPMAQLAIAGQGAFVPGDHCLFCKARTSCAAWYRVFGEAYGMQDARVITDEQRAFLLEYGAPLVKFLNAVRADAVKTLQNRGRVPGFKLIATSGDRKFTDEVAVVEALQMMGYTDEDIYKPAGIKGITAIEKLITAKVFKEALGPYVTKPEGNPKLVREDHAAPAICDTATDAYDAPDLSQF